MSVPVPRSPGPPTADVTLSEIRSHQRQPAAPQPRHKGPSAKLPGFGLHGFGALPHRSFALRCGVSRYSSASLVTLLSLFVPKMRISLQ